MLRRGVHVVVHTSCSVILTDRTSESEAGWAPCTSLRASPTIKVRRISPADSTTHEDVLKSALIRFVAVDMLIEFTVLAEVHWSRLFLRPGVKAQHSIILISLTSVFHEHGRIIDECCIRLI